MSADIMKFLLSSLVVCALLGLNAAQADIFGKDDRNDVLPGFAKAQLARSVAVGVINSLWTDLGNGHSELYADSLSDYMCKDERFYRQKNVSYACSGFLVGPDLLVTAGHCGTNTGEVRNTSDNYCEAYTWLFDFTVGTNVDRVPNKNIYKCKEMIYAVQVEEDGHTYDFALIRLDRVATDRTPLKLATQSVALGDAVTMLGHPMGLPLKYTNNAAVFEPNAGRSFLSNLDAFAGNSGSPVFNSSNEVVGVLIAGNPALATYRDPKAGCDRYNRCDEDGKNCTSLPSGSADGFPNTFSEVQSILPYLNEINSSL